MGEGNSKMVAIYDIDEVAKHCTVNDIWIIFKDEVYDVTPYVKIHPGGEAILRFAGKNATKAVLEQPAHKSVPNFILKTLERFHIGTLSNKGEN